MYVATYEIGIKSSVEAKCWALEEGPNCCISNNWLPIILETKSLMVFNFLSRIREVPWCINMKVKIINGLRSYRESKVQHIPRERNKVENNFY